MRDFTDLTLLLDRSGSMESIRSDVVGGINGFLKTQRDAPGYANFTLIQFDSVDPQEVVIDSQIVTDVKDLTDADFTPRSYTPLYDALGRAIVSTGARLKDMSEDERPDKVVFVVLSDGDENDSKEYTKSMVRLMIETQQEEFNWKFMFLGADMDAFGEAGSIGIKASTTLSGTRAFVRQNLGMTGQSIAAYRTTNDGASLAYSDDDRAKA